MVNHIGEKYERLEIIEFDKKKGLHYYWICKCSCGKVKSIRYSHLKDGGTKSCGCLIREITSKRSTTHGHSVGGNRTSEYRSWEAMISRCTNINSTDYARYGEKGITVCERWLESFENFIEDIGFKPTKFHSIDRINNEGDYKPGNCKWSTKKEQANNRSNNISVINTLTNEVFNSVSIAADSAGINKGFIYDNLRKNRKNRTNFKIIKNDTKDRIQKN